LVFLPFFFSSHVDPRDLPSFPTRRSSDLRWSSKRLRPRCWASSVRRPASWSRCSTPCSKRRPGYVKPNSEIYSCATKMVSHSRRSEEHTSELQSLTNLVCRLLLEKKKK